MAVTSAQEFAGPDLEQDEYYTGKFTKAEDQLENKYNPGVPRVLLTVQVCDEDKTPLKDKDGEPITYLQGVTVKSGSGKHSTIYQIWNAVFFENKGVPDGEPMDTDELVGKWFRFVWGTIENSFDHTSRPGIVKFAPVKKRGGAASKAIEDEIDEV